MGKSNNGRRNVRVWFNCKGERHYCIGTYHPNVGRVYIAEGQAKVLHQKYGCRIGEIYPEGNWGTVVVVCGDGMNRDWKRETAYPLAS